MKDFKNYGPVTPQRVYSQTTKELPQTLASIFSKSVYDR